MSTVDVVLLMGKLSKENYEDWRPGRVPYLERAISGNLRQTKSLFEQSARCAWQSAFAKSRLPIRRSTLLRFLQDRPSAVGETLGAPLRRSEAKLCCGSAPRKLNDTSLSARPSVAEV